MENAQEIIERNTEYLRITVSLFMRKCRQEHRNGMLNREDLFQEAAICFLGEVERYGEETAKTHGRTLHHTLWEAVREAYPLKISYDSFSKAKRQPLKVEPLHGLEHMLAKADPTEKIDTRLDFAAKLEELSEDDRQIIRWRLEGFTQAQIGKRLGVTPTQMCRRLKRIRRQLEQA